MTRPVRPLPVVQNWDCQACGKCCHEYQITLSAAELERIQAQGWDKDPALQGQKVIEGFGWWRRRYRLRQREDGGCVFLSPEGRCRIHERFGSEAKPLACQLYPFMLIPAGDHWRVGLRFSCPSAAAGIGRPLKEHDLTRYAKALAASTGLKSDVPPPRLAPGVSVSWNDLFRFVDAFAMILTERGQRLEHRWRLCLALVRQCRQAHYEKLQGSRLVEFLDVLRNGLLAEVPVDGTQLPEPTMVGYVLFREALALYARCDHGQDRGTLKRSRWSLARSASGFVRGRGPVPRVHAALPEVTFEEVETRSTGLQPEEEELLERYYLTKLDSLQFCGSANYGLTFWEGLSALALTFPVLCWLIRALGGAKRDNVTRAVSMVDHHFGFDPKLGSTRQRFSLNLLSHREELDRLVARYAR